MSNIIGYSPSPPASRTIKELFDWPSENSRKIIRVTGYVREVVNGRVAQLGSLRLCEPGNFNLEIKVVIPAPLEVSLVLASLEKTTIDVVGRFAARPRNGVFHPQITAMQIIK